MTEKLFTGTLNHNHNKQNQMVIIDLNEVDIIIYVPENSDIHRGRKVLVIATLYLYGCFLDRSHEVKAHTLDQFPVNKIMFLKRFHNVAFWF